MTKYKIIVLNVFILIASSLFFFKIFPKLILNHEYNYKGIFVNYANLNEINLIFSDLKNKIEFREKFTIKNKEFINEFLNDLSENKKIHNNSPCPPEVYKNNLRNVQIYLNEFDDNLFNVRFYHNSSDYHRESNFNVDQCFRFIFVENLNKFFSRKIDIYINDLEKNYSYNSSIKKNFDKITYVEYSDFINLIKKNRLSSVKISNWDNNYIITGYFSNQLIYKTEFPENNYMLNEFIKILEQNNISINFDKIEENIKLQNHLVEINKKIKFLKKYRETHNNLYIVDPNLSYNYVEKINNNNYWYQIISFVIFWLAILIIQILHFKLNKKNISKLINNFFNK